MFNCSILLRSIVFCSLLTSIFIFKVLNDVTAKVPAAKYKTTHSSQKDIDYNELPKLLKQWQDIREMEKPQSHQDSDVTEIIVHSSVASVLESKVKFRELAESRARTSKLFS